MHTQRIGGHDIVGRRHIYLTTEARQERLDNSTNEIMRFLVFTRVTAFVVWGSIFRDSHCSTTGSVGAVWFDQLPAYIRNQTVFVHRHPLHPCGVP